MKHFALAEWADFVRGVATAAQRASMQKHLDEGCADCKKTQALWASVQNFAHREMTYEPPANALRIAESYLAPFKLASGRSQTLRLATPTFDSFAGQALAGLRGSGLAPQQLMYKCGNVFIDLRLEPKPATRSIALAGQIVSSEKPAGGVEGIPVSLLAKKETWLETTTNQLGEFHFSFPPGQHLELLFGTKGASVLVVLPDAEGLG